MLDIVARICGICPIAYQMSAVHAFEDLAGVRDRPRGRARSAGCSTAASGSRATRSTSTSSTRRTSSAARTPSSSPRSTGPPSNAGSRSRRPATGSCPSSAAARSTRSASASAGSRGSRRGAELEALRPDLERALDQAHATVEWVATFNAPDFERSERFVALRHPDEYPFNEGRIVSSDGLDLAPTDWEAAFRRSRSRGRTRSRRTWPTASRTCSDPPRGSR